MNDLYRRAFREVVPQIIPVVAGTGLLLLVLLIPGLWWFVKLPLGLLAVFGALVIFGRTHLHAQELMREEEENPGFVPLEPIQGLVIEPDEPVQPRRRRGGRS